MTFNDTSDFDIDMARGMQGQLFVDNVQRMLKEKTGQIEVKTDYWFATTGRWYIERECLSRGGNWKPSGIQTTKSKLWMLVAGRKPNLMLPFACVIGVLWLRRAVAVAVRSPANHKSCDYGENPTRGVLVYVNNHIVQTAPDSVE